MNAFTKNINIDKFSNCETKVNVTFESRLPDGMLFSEPRNFQEVQLELGLGQRLEIFFGFSNLTVFFARILKKL